MFTTKELRLLRQRVSTFFYLLYSNNNNKTHTHTVTTFFCTDPKDDKNMAELNKYKKYIVDPSKPGSVAVREDVRLVLEAWGIEPTVGNFKRWDPIVDWKRCADGICGVNQFENTLPGRRVMELIEQGNYLRKHPSF